MNLKYAIAICLLLSLLQGMHSPMLCQQREFDSINSLIEIAPENSEKRFKEVMALATIYRRYVKPYELKKLDTLNFRQDYLNYGTKALSWAEKSGSAKQLAQARRFQLDYLDHYNKRIDINDIAFLSLGQQMLSEGVFHSPEDEFHVYKVLTDSYSAKGFYKEFLTLLPKKFELARQLKKPFSEPFREYSALGTIYYRLKDYTTARVYYKKTLKAKELDSFSLTKASITNNVALTFAKQGLQDSSVYYYNKAIEVIETGIPEYFDFKTKNYHEHIIDVINSNIAYLGVKDGNYNPALTAIKRELYTGKREREHTTVIQAYNKLGEIYYYKKQYILAEKYLDSTKILFNLGGVNDEDQIKILKQRAKIMLATNRQDEAEKIFTQAQKFEDSITLLKSLEQTKIATVLYETEAKEKELQAQRLALAKQNEEILKKEKSQIIYSVILGILVVSLLIFYLLNRKIKVQKQEVESQKRLVDTSLKEKEILLKEVHHRVKNNLQVVSSLLIKQGEVSENSSIKKLMEDGQNRIKSMAMVHQLLYQTEDFRNLNLKEYTKLLVDSISGSQQFQEMNIITNIEMEDIYSHIDIAVPYGLILNELLSNCFEHGFPQGGSGEITISAQHIADDEYKLTVVDTGKGIPSNIDSKKEKSLGLNLIKGLAWQLRGELAYENTQVGSQFSVSFQNNLKNIS